MNSTPWTFSWIIRASALLPAPPVPSTRMMAPGRTSGRTSRDAKALVSSLVLPDEEDEEEDLEPENMERNVSDMGGKREGETNSGEKTLEPGTNLFDCTGHVEGSAAHPLLLFADAPDERAKRR